MTADAEGQNPSSAESSRSRPFYSAWADAYDLLVDDPVDPWVEAVHAAVTIGGRAPASILDAGCGTGRHAAALAALGHRITLLDASPDLLAIAQRRCPEALVREEDLTRMRRTQTYDAVACRGVLNDLITDEERQGALEAMGASLLPGGAMVLDVREVVGSARRADGQPRSRTVELGRDRPELPAGATLTFTSTATWQEGLMLVHEEHRLDAGEASDRVVNDFRMRPWSRAELLARLSAAGIDEVKIRRGHGKRSIDRLLVVGRA